MKRFHLLQMIFLVFLYACHEEKDEPFTAPQNILFIGNSYTFYNKGLAYHLSNFAINDSSIPQVRVEEVAKGGYTLENHWNDTATINKIKARHWDAIIIQEQSLRPVSDKDQMLLYVQKFDSLIKSAGNAKVYLFMTWAYKNYPDMIYPLSEAYKEAGKNTGSTVVPVGLEWDKFLKSKDAMNLYDPDGQHPDIQGTFFTASIFYKVLFRKKPGQNQYRDPLLSDHDGTLLKGWGDNAQAIEY
jgi:hypothetical protein